MSVGPQENLDLIWTLVAAALVFFMQAGFACLETGLVRAKNSINVAIKNITDLVMSIAGFWFVGFGLMFGATYGGIFGFSAFALIGHEAPMDYTFFIFQAVFAGTAVTIVSGALAERIRFYAYMIASVVIGGFIYPIFGHWAWGGAFLSGESGWLADMGFIDFAGSSVVHSIGAWVGLAGVLIIGPRLGRFKENGEVVEIPGHNIPMAALGVFILWFGWFGFNGGSGLVGDGSVAKIILNTNLAAAIGGISAFLTSIVFMGRPVVEKLFNGILGGLVGITAGCAAVTPMGAVLIGFTSGQVVYWSEEWLLNMGIDDPVGAIPVHGFCGAWGTIALAFIAPADALAAGSRMAQIYVQCLGSASAFVWSFGTGLLLFWLLNRKDHLRVDPEDEMRGLNISEHGAKMSWVDTITTIKGILDTGDLSRRVTVENGTEMGVVAQSLNDFLDEVEKNANAALKVAEGDLTFAIRPKSEMDKLGLATERMVGSLRRAKLSRDQVISSIMEIVRTGDLSRRVEVDSASELSEVAGNFNALLDELFAAARVAQSVSEGDLETTLLPKSDRDILAHAVVRMVESLRAAKLSREETISTIKGIVRTGDLSRRVSLEGDPDMAEVASSFNVLLDEIMEAANFAQCIAEGDLSRTIVVKSDKDHLGIAINTMVTSLHKLISRVEEVGMALADSILDLDTSSQDLSSANKEIVTSISRASNLVAESIKAVQVMNEQAMSGVETKEMTVDSIQEVGASLNDLSGSIRNFSSTTRKISEFTDVIKNIAGQTNLLALNATIQAADAGEAGRGFSVVAAEIKNLALESERASEEVVKLVEDIVRETEGAISQARTSQETTGHISKRMASSLAEAFAGIKSAVADVSKIMESIAVAANNQNSVVSQNARAVDSITSISYTLRSKAETLAKAINRFKLETEDERGFVSS